DQNSARKGDKSTVRMLDIKKRAARLSQFADLAARHIKIPCGSCLLHCNVDRTEPCIIHSRECDKVSSAIDDSDVHTNLQFPSFCFCGFYGFFRLFQCYLHRSPLYLKSVV